MAIEMSIDLSDLTEDAVRRLLKEAVMHQARNSKPVGKRGNEDEEECDCCGKPSCDCECDEENMGSSDLARGEARTNLPPVKSDDLPVGMNLSKYRKKKRGEGKNNKSQN